ncbi:MAG: transposase [Ruminococcus sp.]|nr:transposase [Ruminococcus sp.]
MPNHIHILVSVYNSGMSKSPSPTNETIPSFVSTFKRFVNKEAGENIFQRSYYDHIVRDERDYLSRWQYIENNPIKWEEDELIKDCVSKLPLA